MRSSVLSVIFASLVLSGIANAQDPGAAQQNGANGGFQRGGPRGFGGMAMGMPGGRGLMGTVTEVAGDHFKIKTEEGQSYTVYYSANTRIMKQPAGGRGPGDGNGRRGGDGAATGYPRGGTPPESIKASEIKIGDAIGAMGEQDQKARSIGAVAIMLLDAEAARRMEEMRANYGKTWIQGKVTAIDGVKVTVMGIVDNAPHAFVADENTTFRKRREPITLADIEVGDMLRADGTVKDGVFTASSVSVMGMPPAGAMPGGPQNGYPPPPQ
jgi:hypothetical protein